MGNNALQGAGVLQSRIKAGKTENMRSSKSRSRSKSNRPRSIGNIVNRVFDSSGPDGKVRGTPQQIIEKYLFLARDAQLSNDRVAAENFNQHAEHYTRMLGEAQRELAAEQETRRQPGDQMGNQGQGAGPGQGGQNGGQYRDRTFRDERPDPRDDAAESSMPSRTSMMIEFPYEGEESGLVETPEARLRQEPPRPEYRDRPRRAEQPERQERSENQPRAERKDDRKPRADTRKPRVEQQESPAPDAQPENAAPLAEQPASAPAADPVVEVAAAPPKPARARAPRKPRADSAAKGTPDPAAAAE